METAASKTYIQLKSDPMPSHSSLKTAASAALTFGERRRNVALSGENVPIEGTAMTVLRFNQQTVTQETTTLKTLMGGGQ